MSPTVSEGLRVSDPFCAGPLVPFSAAEGDCQGLLGHCQGGCHRDGRGAATFLVTVVTAVPLVLGY